MNLIIQGGAQPTFLPEKSSPPRAQAPSNPARLKLPAYPKPAMLLAFDAQINLFD